MYCTCLLAMPVPQKPRPITLMDPSLLLCVIMYIETLILLGHCTYSMWQMSAESAQGFLACVHLLPVNRTTLSLLPHHTHPLTPRGGSGWVQNPPLLLEKCQSRRLPRREGDGEEGKEQEESKGVKEKKETDGAMA